MDHIQSTGQEIKDKIRRDLDSPDDFEHLGHDSSPLQDLTHDTGDLLGLKTDRDTHVRLPEKIDRKGVEGNVGIKFSGDFSAFNPSQPAESLLDKPLVPEKMDSNLFDQMGDHFPDRKEADDKLDKFLQEMSSPFAADNPPVVIKDKYNADNIKSFMDNERKGLQENPLLDIEKEKSHELLDRYSDSDAESDDFKPSKYEEFPKAAELPESSYSTESLKADNFKDIEETQPEIPKKDYPLPSALLKEPQNKSDSKNDEKLVSEKPKEFLPKSMEAVPVTKDDKPQIKKAEVKDAKTEAAKKVIEAEALFRKMGLDAWFNPEKLHPKVESLIYWREPKKSGPVFGGVLLILLALTYFSLISVVAYFSLITLTGTIAFRIYKNIVQAVQKTGDGHPFKETLELDISLPQEKVKEISEVTVAHVNAALVELRRLFLVEDLVDSIKFGAFLWVLTYLGSWFNGMTLIIIAWVALFTLPKVYETNKTQIDANLEIVRAKLADITSKVKAAIPIGKKTEEKKEQ